MNDPRIYDQIYSKGGHKKSYLQPWRKSRYHPIWLQAARWIETVNSPKILDVGCGVGQFAELLFSRGMTDYQGIDFSSVAINRAKRINPDVFLCIDAFKFKANFSRFNVVCYLEILEHVYDDERLIAMAKSGSNVILSVPNFDASTHVRIFADIFEVKSRYKSLIKFQGDGMTFEQGGTKQIYLLRGVRK